MKDKREKYVFPGGRYQWEVGGHKERGMRVNMADIFCIHI
jgi:hypothetical protein